MKKILVLLSVALLLLCPASHANGDPVKEKQKTFKVCKTGSCYLTEARRNEVLNYLSQQAGHCFVESSAWEETPCADCFTMYCYSLTVAPNCNPNSINWVEPKDSYPSGTIKKMEKEKDKDTSRRR